MSRKLLLNSNFTDGLFDAFFDGRSYSGYSIDSDCDEKVHYNRRNDIGPNRIESFDFFRKHHINHSLFGHYDVFVQNYYNKDQEVVIYDDIRSHCGENKRLCMFSDLKESDKVLYLSEYVKTDKNLFSQYQSKSTRYLFVGPITFSYDYYSLEDWRSNVGDGIITNAMLFDTPVWRNQLNRAMWAIDFVGPSHDLKAIDLNISPGIHGVKFPSGFSYSYFVYLMKDWIEKYGVDEWSE